MWWFLLFLFLGEESEVREGKKFVESYSIVRVVDVKFVSLILEKCFYIWLGCF